MDLPGTGPDPEIRGPLISMLTQWYTGADKPTAGQDVELPDVTASLVDLIGLFVLYVREAAEDHDTAAMEAVAAMAAMFAEYARNIDQKHPGSFLEFLQRQAREAYFSEEPD
jgi:hypothetical protein